MCEIGRSSLGANSALISLAAVAAAAQKPLNVFSAYLPSRPLKKNFPCRPHFGVCVLRSACADFYLQTKQKAITAPPPRAQRKLTDSINPGAELRCKAPPAARLLCLKPTSLRETSPYHANALWRHLLARLL